MMRARIRRTSSRSRLRESTGNATRSRMPLIFAWYSEPSWKPRR